MRSLLLPLALLVVSPLVASSSLPTFSTASHHLIARQDVNTTAPLPTDSPCIASLECESNFCYNDFCTDPASVQGQVSDGGQCFDDTTCENFAAGTSVSISSREGARDCSERGKANGKLGNGVADRPVLPHSVNRTVNKGFVHPTCPLILMDASARPILIAPRPSVKMDVARTRRPAILHVSKDL